MIGPPDKRWLLESCAAYMRICSAKESPTAATWGWGKRAALLERWHDLVGEQAQTPLHALGRNLSAGVELGDDAV
jgi:hypothetical protein